MNRLFIVVALIVFGMHAASYAQTKRIAVAYSAVSATQSSFYVTKEAGLFEKHGLFVDPVYVASGTKVAQAMIAGEAEDFIDRRFTTSWRRAVFSSPSRVEKSRNIFQRPSARGRMHEAKASYVYSAWLRVANPIKLQISG